MDEQPMWVEAEVRRSHRGWRVLIPCEDGRVLEYRYARRRQAEYFASVFRLEPTWYPKPHRVRASLEETGKLGRLIAALPAAQVDADADADFDFESDIGSDAAAGAASLLRADDAEDGGVNVDVNVQERAALADELFDALDDAFSEMRA